MKHLFISLLILSALVGCASTQPIEASVQQADVERETPPTGAADDAAASVNQMGFDLYQAAHTPDENLVFSPYSIQLAFSMLYGGARGETDAQLAEVLHLLPQAEHHRAMNALDQRFDVPEEPMEFTPTVNIANAVWGDVGFEVNDPYLELLAAQYGANLRTLEMDDGSAAAPVINGWVEEQTEGRIDKLVQPDMFNEMTRMVLVNAIYFLAQWSTPFAEEATSDEPFTLLNGEEVRVPTMHLNRLEAEYAAGEGFAALRLPYITGDGPRYEMIVILPEDFSSFTLASDWEQSLTYNWYFVNVALPKVDTESTLDLTPTMQSMGLTLPFDPNNADLSGIAPIPPRLFVSDAVHKANITINEEGTEAAAATALIVMEESGPPDYEEVDFTVDRPFIFLIREVQSGATLFLGHVVDPRE